MEHQNATTDEACVNDLCQAFMKNGVISGSLSGRDEPEKFVEAHIMPRELEVADDLAAEHGFERVDNVMDRRTYKPEQ